MAGALWVLPQVPPHPPTTPLTDPLVVVVPGEVVLGAVVVADLLVDTSCKGSGDGSGRRCDDPIGIVDVGRHPWIHLVHPELGARDYVLVAFEDEAGNPTTSLGCQCLATCTMAECFLMFSWSSPSSFLDSLQCGQISLIWGSPELDPVQPVLADQY